MSDAEALLVTILADVDVIHTPRRFHNLSLDAWVLLDERQRAYAEHGVPWASGGTSERDRKTQQRNLEALAEQGFVVAHRSAGRTVGIRLTPKGDQHARALANLPDMVEAFPHLRRMVRLQQKGFDAEWSDRFQGWLPETLLTGCEWGAPASREPFGKLQAEVLPVIIRGWLRTNSSVKGHLWYYPTAAGIAASRDDTHGTVPNDVPEPLPPAREIYGQRYNQTKSNLCNASHVDGEIGPIPLPVSYARS